MVETTTLTLRPARSADIPAVADLLLQLYHAELPGALGGPAAGQQKLMRHILEHGRAALFRQYVAADQQGNILATASLRLGRDRVLADMPAGTMSMAFHELGTPSALRLFGLLLRRSFTPETRLSPQDAFLHSVVVAEHMRGQGVGAWLIHRVEQVAWQDGARVIQLRVIVGNDRAKRVYQRLGYQVIARTPPFLGWLTVPTELMSKALSPAP